MILGNYNIYNQNPGREIGGTTNAAAWFKGGTLFGRLVGVGSSKSSFFTGYLHPYNIGLPKTAGALSLQYTADGSSVLSGVVAGGKNAEASFSGTGSIDSAEWGLLAGMITEMAGSGALSADVLSIILATCTMSGSTAMTVNITAIASLLSEFIGSSAVTLPMTAKGNISANITPFTELSPQSLAASIWNSIATEFNESGTMGYKLNAASSGGVDYDALVDAVWDALLSQHDNAGSAGKALTELKAQLSNVGSLQALSVKLLSGLNRRIK